MPGAAAILDIDGTLVDTNYQHTLAWWRAMRSEGLTVPTWRIHRHVGMGGDQLIAAVAGDEVEERSGDAIRDAEKELYQGMIDEVRPLPGALELLDEVERREMPIVLASSAKEDEVEHYLDLLDARERCEWTTSADVDATKPQPDLIEAAIEKLEGSDPVLVGDTVWDVEAGKRAGVPVIGVLTGGFAASELREAGAIAVYESVAELASELTESPLFR